MRLLKRMKRFFGLAYSVEDVYLCCMRRLIVHIERLLLTHDCVILPGFGGFVSRTMPAAYREEEHIFQPERKEIMFNVTLCHTDGLLSESYMRAYDVDYRQASLMLEEDIDTLRSALEKDKRFVLGRIGMFEIGEEGQVVFSPGDSDALNAESYGLSSFCFPLLPSLETGKEENVLEEKAKRADVFYIPVSRKLVRAITVSAATVALFLVISTPVREVNQSAYKASFIPAEMMRHKAEEPLSVREDNVVAPLPVEVRTGTESVCANGGEAKASPAFKESKGLASAPQKSERKKMYHVVIASFLTEEQANEYIAGVDRVRYGNVGVVLRNGKYRIYADKFDNRADAEAYMEGLRAGKYKDAWLFISR